MTKSKLIRSKIIFLVLVFCFLRKSATLKENVLETSSSDSTTFEEISRSYRPETSTAEHPAAERNSRVKKPVLVYETKGNFDGINDIFNRFMTFPFFPFHIPDLKRSIFHLNSSEKPISSENDKETAGNRPPRKSKPFLFIDLAFNMQEIPIKNHTKEDGLDTVYPTKTVEDKASEVRRQKNMAPFHVFDDDWSFFDDSLLPPRDTEEFLPKSDLLFFDLPFRGKQNKKQTRSKRDKAPSKSGINMLMNIFDKTILRTKKEMEKSMPLWDFMRGAKGEKRDTLLNTLQLLDGDDTDLPQDTENKWNKRSPAKWNSRELVHPKSPTLLGKVVKIGEIHFREEHPKSKKKKKKRRNSSSSRRNERHGFHEISIEEVNEPVTNFASLKDVIRKIHEENTQGRQSVKALRGTQDAKILDLMAQWDRRAMEEQLEGKTPKSETVESYNKNEVEKVPEDVRGLIPKDKSFRYVSRNSGKRDKLKTNAGFEMVKPQQSPARRKRQGSEDGGNWENVTASKDDIRRNITQVLGMFFCMIKKLLESTNLHHDKENQEREDVIWPEMAKELDSRSYGKDAAKTWREVRHTEAEDTSAPVADLNYLFLTVTLPTTLAFTLLLVICFFNLRAKSWLCRKVFQPRNVYIVEEDVEKSKPLGVKPTAAAKSHERKKPHKQIEEKKIKIDDLQPEAEM